MIVYSNLVMQVLTPMHSSTLSLPYCLHKFLVSHRPVNIWSCKHTFSATLATTTLCSVFSISVSFTFILLPSFPSTLKSLSPYPKESTQVRGLRKSPAVRNSRLFEGLPPWDILQRKQVSLKGKVETPSSAMHAAFLPYKALKYTNTTTNPTVHPLRPLKPWWTMCHDEN